MMMAYETSESTRDNFGKFIHQFQPEAMTLICKLERILRQNLSLLFNQIYIYIYIYVCVCVWKEKKRLRERSAREGESKEKIPRVLIYKCVVTD